MGTGLFAVGGGKFSLGLSGWLAQVVAGRGGMLIAEQDKNLTSDSGLLRGLRVFCMVLLLLAAVGYYRSFQANTIDDAGISFQYARNFARGNGFRYHAEFEPVEGFSNPLWTLVLSAGFFFGFTDLIFLAKILGGICWFFSGLIFIFTLRKPLAIVFFTLLFLSPQNAYWANSGMENASLQLILSALLIFRFQKHVYSILLLLLIISRPEGILYALAALFFSPRKIVDLQVILGTLIFMTVFRMVYFHDFLPNTFYAKRGWIHSADPLYNLRYGFEYWLTYFRQYAGFAWLGVVLIFYTVYRRLWLPLLFVLVHLFFLCFVGGDWMQHFRFMTFLFPLFTALTAELLTIFCVRRSELTAFFMVVLLNIAFLGAKNWYQDYEQLQKPYLSLEARMNRGRYFEQLALDLGIKNPSLLDPDVGGTAYGTELRVLDLVGLTNREIGKSEKKEADFRSFFMYHKPDFIYSAGVWNQKTHLFTMPELFRDYVPLNGSIYIDPLTTQSYLIRRIHEPALRELKRSGWYE
jgi:hypothetical protein